MASPVVHFEIVGRNGAELQRFYSDLFGWKIDASNPMQYGLVEAGERGIGGGVTGGDTPQATFYIEVGDPQAVLAKIEKAGGKVVVPVTEIPGMVTFAQFSDPEGNLIGLVKGP